MLIEHKRLILLLYCLKLHYIRMVGTTDYTRRRSVLIAMYSSGKFKVI